MQAGEREYMLRTSKWLLLLLTTVALSGCGTLESRLSLPSQSGNASVGEYPTDLHLRSVHTFDPVNLSARVDALQLQPKHAKVYFVVDHTVASDIRYRGVPVNDYGHEIVSRFLETTPATLKSEIYVGSVKTDKSNPVAFGQLVAGKQPNKRTTDESVVARSISDAIDMVGALISEQRDSAAIILLADWDAIDLDVENAVMRLKQRVGASGGYYSGSQSTVWQGTDQSICFYAVGRLNRMSRSRLSGTDNCGFSIAADKVMQPQEMAFFVEQVVYTDPRDSDGDGVFDYMDACPGTLSGKLVNYQGCPKFKPSVAGD